MLFDPWYPAIPKPDRPTLGGSEPLPMLVLGSAAFNKLRTDRKGLVCDGQSPGLQAATLSAFAAAGGASPVLVVPCNSPHTMVDDLGAVFKQKCASTFLPASLQISLHGMRCAMSAARVAAGLRLCRGACQAFTALPRVKVPLALPPPSAPGRSRATKGRRQCRPGPRRPLHRLHAGLYAPDGTPIASTLRGHSGALG